MPKKLKMFVLASLLMTSGCAPEISNGCSWVTEINPSRKDVLTERTKEQIKQHNYLHYKFCEDKPFTV